MTNTVPEKFSPFLLVVALFSGSAMAAEPDFFINFSSCKSLYAPMSLAENPLQVSDGDPSLFACSRQGTRITCQLRFEDGKQGIKGNVGEYKVDIDVPPTLSFKLVKGNEYILVNTTEHTAIMSSLLLDKRYAGSKVCHGIYLTNFEFKNLRNNGNP